MPESPEVRAALDAGDDPVPVIGESGLSHRCGLCSRSLDLFVSAYGAAAGNLALVGTATGGVYVGGGIAPKLLPRIQEGGFLRSFLDKGRFEGYMRAIPVRVILNQKTAMYGAARLASLLRVG
jgi:glucokinase